MAKKPKRLTMRDVKARMRRLGITGWSSMAKWTPAEMMRHLDEIEQIKRKRKQATDKRS